jgi:hypothetical protein
MGMNDPRKVTDSRYLAQISPPKKFKKIPRSTSRQSNNTFINELSLNLGRLLFQRIGVANANHAGNNKIYENVMASVTTPIINIVKFLELQSRTMVDPAIKSAVAKYRLKKPSLRQNDKRAGLRAKSRPPETNNAFKHFRDFVGISLSPKTLKKENTIIPIARR